MSRFRQVLVAVQIVMIVGFGIATSIVSAQKGIAYREALLHFQEEGNVCRYRGLLDGKQAEFTVTDGRTVNYRWGDEVYGPYQIVDDPTASPKGENFAGRTLPGIEIRCKDEVIFRGGYTSSEVFLLIREDGEWAGDMLSISYGTSGGVVYDANGNELTQRDLHEPGVTTIFRVAMQPELTHRGNFGLYLLVTLLAVFNIFQICCPGFMFRWSIMWHVKDPDTAEPSDFYIAMERLEWIFLTGLAVWLYWMALMEMN